MDRDLLIKIMTGSALNTGDLVGFYDFGKYSGAYTFNEKYADPTGDSIKGGHVIADSYPLYSICDQDSINSISGSGYFDQDSVLQVGTKFPYSGWTIILDYESDDFTGNYDLGRTLFSSMDSPSSTSGFNIGLNGANKPYFQYVDTGNSLRTFTLSSELGKRNILAFSKEPESSLLEINFYDPLYKVYNTGSFVMTDHITSTSIDKTYSNQLFVGDFFSGGAGYTGFSGYIDHLILHGSYIPAIERKLIATSLPATGYLPKRYEPVQTISNLITGATHSTSGVTGQGITGYSYVESGIVDSKCGSDIGVYSRSGLTGDKTGVIYTFVTGSTPVTGISLVEKSATPLYSPSELFRYKRANLSKRAWNEDHFEVYNYTGIQTGLNAEATPYAGLSYYEIPSAFTSKPIIFYVNGLYKDSGHLSGSSIVSGEYHVSGVNKEKIVFENDVSLDNIVYNNIFDVATGQVYTTGYTSGADGTIWDSVTSSYEGMDVYLNGQKLLSGYNYIEGADDHVYIYRSTLNRQPSGELAFVPKRQVHERITKSGTSSFSGVYSGYLDEQTWLNGQRLKRQEDYLLISENSLLNQTGTVKLTNRDTLFDGQDIGFV